VHASMKKEKNTYPKLNPSSTLSIQGKIYTDAV